MDMERMFQTGQRADAYFPAKTVKAISIVTSRRRLWLTLRPRSPPWFWGQAGVEVPCPGREAAEADVEG